MPAFFNGQNIFFQERCLFSRIRIHRAPPVLFVAPVGCIGKSKLITGFVFVPLHTSTAMVEMKMRKKYIGDIFRGKAIFLQRLFKRIITMEIIIAQKFFILLLTYSIINQHQPVSFLHKQTTHRPCAHIIFIGRIQFVPNAFWNYAKHSSAIKLKKSRINCK